MESLERLLFEMLKTQKPRSKSKYAPKKKHRLQSSIAILSASQNDKVASSTKFHHTCTIIPQCTKRDIVFVIFLFMCVFLGSLFYMYGTIALLLHVLKCKMIII